MEDREYAPEAAIASVVRYMWEAEFKDYCQQDDDGRSHHIFHDLQEIRDWLERQPGCV